MHRDLAEIVRPFGAFSIYAARPLKTTHLFSSLTVTAGVTLLVASSGACSRKPPPVPTCVAAIDEAGAKAEERWRERAKGKNTPMSNEEDRVMSRCAALYSEKSCREANENFDNGPAEMRLAVLAKTCRDAYCPKLAAPKPTLCENKDPSTGDYASGWRELDTAILKHDHGANAEPVLEAKKRANLRVMKAAEAYYDAGAPDFLGPRDAGASDAASTADAAKAH